MAAGATAKVLKGLLLAALAACTVALAGCGGSEWDPATERSDAQAEELRERLRTGQGAT